MPDNSEKQIYISTQQFCLLDQVNDPRYYLDPARFRAVRDYFQQQREQKESHRDQSASAVGNVDVLKLRFLVPEERHVKA